jgi:hypothetical protein
VADTAGTADTSQEWLSEHHAPAPAAPATESAPLAPAPQAAAAGTTTLQQPAQWFIDFLAGNPGGDRGPIVNEFTALNYAALYACVSLIAGTVASLPLKVYRKRADGGQDEAHPAGVEAVAGRVQPEHVGHVRPRSRAGAPAHLG